MHKFLKLRNEHLWELLFFVLIYFLSQLPIRDFDIWFHLKSGELFSNLGHLQFTEPFSFAAYGRNWVPYEWLFQIVSYQISRINMALLPFFISFFVVLNIFFFIRILALFGLNIYFRFFLAFVYFVASYEFNTIRPHVLAYAFLMLTLYLIYKRLVHDKKWLYISPVCTFVWTNLHSSSFISWGLMLTFSFLSLIQFLFTKEKKYFAEFWELMILALLNFAVTITPPLGFRDYQLLWSFFSEREFLGVFIAEWGPPQQENIFGFYLYLGFFAFAICSFVFVVLKEKKILSKIILIPPFIMGIVGFLATRNVILGVGGLLLIIGSNFSFISRLLTTRKKKIIVTLFFILAVILNIKLLGLKMHEVKTMRLYFPVQAGLFAKNNLSGKMFNDYSYGGYLLYATYPKLQVFIDGRADVYLCCEMKEYLLLAANKHLRDDEYQKFLNGFFNKYQISFAIVSPQKHNIFRRITKLLSKDPDWTLIFWDDDAQIFVKKDGKNDGIIKSLETKYATPYLREPFPKDKIEKSLFEYERMDAVAKSARTSNAIGYIFLLQNEFQKAKDRFNDAINRDPTFESPFMNLAELAFKDREIKKAIGLYQKAQSLAPDRGLIYIRWGQFILEDTHDKNLARKIWEMGIKNTVDDDARKKLAELLQTL
jgi:hypothetical protein